MLTPYLQLYSCLAGLVPKRRGQYVYWSMYTNALSYSYPIIGWRLAVNI